MQAGVGQACANTLEKVIWEPVVSAVTIAQRSAQTQRPLSRGQQGRAWRKILPACVVRGVLLSVAG